MARSKFRREAEVVCSRCGKKFIKRQHYIDLTESHFCSMACRDGGCKPKQSYKFT